MILRKIDDVVTLWGYPDVYYLGIQHGVGGDYLLLFHDDTTKTCLALHAHESMAAIRVHVQDSRESFLFHRQKKGIEQ